MSEDQTKINSFKVLVAKKHGVLSKFYTRLESAGYAVAKHHVEINPDQDTETIEFFVTGRLPLPPALAQSILEIPECLNFVDAPVVSNNPPQEVDVKQIAKSVAGKVYTAFPKVKPILDQALQSVDASKRDALLKAIGVYVGSIAFKEEYSLGLPMKMTPYIKRALVPALKPLSDISYKDNEVSFDNNAYCSANPSDSYCEFVNGMIQGMVYSNLPTRQVSVQKTSCMCRADSACTFVFI